MPTHALLEAHPKNMLHALARSAERAPAEFGERCSGGPTAGLLALLWAASRGELRGVLKLACRSCSARLARSSATAILCAALCMTGGFIRIPCLMPVMPGLILTWRFQRHFCRLRLMRSRVCAIQCSMLCMETGEVRHDMHNKSTALNARPSTFRV